MRRQVLGVLLLAAAALGVPASAQPVPGRSASDVSVVPGGCGSGQTAIRTASTLSCVHPDLYDARAQAPWVGRAPVTAPPRCYGDGQTGPRVQMIYGYLAGKPNRSATVVQQVRSQMAPRMQAVVAAASAGRDLGIRFAFEKGCRQLSVPVVRFPASVVSGSPGATAEGQLGRMITHLESLGFDRTDRKYQVIWDWNNAGAVCGLGELAAEVDQPNPVNVHNGTPTVGARTDAASVVGLQGVVPSTRFSAVWRTAFGPRGPGCWELDQSKAGVQVHELFHTLGAVQLSAPHSDGGGHCTDTPSVMCPASGKPIVPSCAAQRVQVLDCRSDDFWNPAPPAGSYLATRHNVATSQFFGPQVQDQLALSPV